MWSRIFLAFALTALPLRAATINAASTSKADVESAIATAVNGDTVVLPSGDSTWTGTLFLTNKAIRLTGAGVGNTIIRDGSSESYFIRIWLQAGRTTEIDNIEFRGAGGFPTDRIWIEGMNNDNRHINWHHCKFDQMDGPIWYLETVRGVIHNNVIIGKAGVSVIVAHTKDSFYNGTFQTRDFGNGSYAADNYFGTTNFVFLEANFVTNAVRAAAMDGQAGSRYVYRFNTNYNVTMETHGSEAAERSGRAFEIYGNYMYGNGVHSTPVFMRGGVTLCFSNTFTNWVASGTALSLLDNRVGEALFPPFGGATGDNPWDSNNVTIFASGTVTGTNGSTTITNSGAAMTAGQYTNYNILATSGKTVTSLTRSGSTATATVTGHGWTNGSVVAIWGADQYAWNHVFTITVVDANTFTFTMPYTPASPATGTIKARKGNRFSRILENGTTTIRYYDSVYEPTFPYGLRFEVGDTYEIRLVEASMDQCGLWGGTNFGTAEMPNLISGFAGTQNVSLNAEWENYHNGADINWQRTGAFGTLLAIVPGKHYTNNTALAGYAHYPYPHYIADGSSPPIIGGGSSGTRGPRIRGIRLRP